MATYRHIHVTFWQDELILDLTPEQKYFYIYLMTNEKTTQVGVYRIAKSVMAFELGYDVKTIDNLLKLFVENGRILYNPDEQEIMLVNWLKYNKTSSPKVGKFIDKQIQEIKTDSYKSLAIDLCIQYGYSINTESQEKEKEKQKEKQKEKEEVLPSSDSLILEQQEQKNENQKSDFLNQPDSEHLPTNMIIANGIARSMIAKGLCTDMNKNHFLTYFDELLKNGFDEDLIRYVVFEKTKNLSRPNVKYYTRIFDEYEAKGVFNRGQVESKQTPKHSAGKIEVPPNFWG